MIEVLITIVIVIIGLLGLLEMQSRLQKSEVESYQRTQALILLNDMVSRMSANRAFVGRYATEVGAYTGVGDSCDDPNDIALPTASDPNAVGAYVVELDVREWCVALQGAAEVSDSGSNVGAMIGARGCIESIPPEYRISVVWQGLTPIKAPPAAVSCASGLGFYDQPPGSDCAANAESCRRYVATQIRIADLSP